MNLRLTKQRVFSLGGAALLSLSMAVPALAVPNDPYQDVIVTGTVLATLSFEIDNSFVAFGAVDPLGTLNDESRSAVDTNGVSDGACYVSNTAVHFAIKSNQPYEGQVAAWENEGFHTAGLGLDKLHRVEPTYPNPLYSYDFCPWTWDFSGSYPYWTFGGPTALAEVTNEYALQVDWADPSGNINFLLVYAVFQL
jgi:hypothetical protein